MYLHEILSDSTNEGKKAALEEWGIGLYYYIIIPKTNGIATDTFKVYRFSTGEVCQESLCAWQIKSDKWYIVNEPKPIKVFDEYDIYNNKNTNYIDTFDITNGIELDLVNMYGAKVNTLITIKNQELTLNVTELKKLGIKFNKDNTNVNIIGGF